MYLAIAFRLPPEAQRMCIDNLFKIRIPVIAPADVLYRTRGSDSVLDVEANTTLNYNPTLVRVAMNGLTKKLLRVMYEPLC